MVNHLKWSNEINSPPLPRQNSLKNDRKKIVQRLLTLGRFQTHRSPFPRVDDKTRQGIGRLSLIDFSPALPLSNDLRERLAPSIDSALQGRAKMGILGGNFRTEIGEQATGLHRSTVSGAQRLKVRSETLQRRRRPIEEKRFYRLREV